MCAAMESLYCFNMLVVDAFSSAIFWALFEDRVKYMFRNISSGIFEAATERDNVLFYRV